MQYLMLLLTAVLFACSHTGTPDESVGSVEQAAGWTLQDDVTFAHWRVTIPSNLSLPCGLSYRDFMFSGDDGYYPAVLYNPGCPWWTQTPKHVWAWTVQFPGEQYLIGAWRCPQGSWWVDNTLTLLPEPTWNDWFHGGVTGSLNRVARNSAGTIVCQKSVAVTAVPE